MAQFGKGSGKRGKPTYAYAIIGVALVLFLFGLMGWLAVGIQKSGDLAKEKLKIRVTLMRVASQKEIDTIKSFITALPYTKDVEFVSKEQAAEEYTKMENDTLWKRFMGGVIPFDASLAFNVKADYIQKDSLQKLDTILRDNYGTLLGDIQYPLETVSNINKFAKWVLWVLIALILIIGIIVIISIDNTIRLAMYSNRFIMKTMQMVGATRGFVLRPLLVRSIINGLISAIIAIGLLLGFVWLAEKFVPILSLIRENRYMFMLCTIIVILGVVICLGSTYRSVLKYLKMKLDDLY